MSDRPATLIKTARFSVVLAKCGQPAVHLTLVAPQKDPPLRKLERETRVMTIHRAHRGAGADYGVVGIDPGPGIQLLVFPRSLRRFTGKRIVGINYDLIDSDLHVTGRPSAGRKLKLSRRAEPPLEPVALFPKPGRTSPTTRNAEEDHPPPEPLTMAETLRDLRAIERLLRQKRYAAARDETHRLVAAFASGIKDWPP